MVIFAIIFIINIILIIVVVAILIIIRSRLAIVSQEPVLFNKSIADNIRLAMAVSLFENMTGIIDEKLVTKESIRRHDPSTQMLGYIHHHRSPLPTFTDAMSTDKGSKASQKPTCFVSR